MELDDLVCYCFHISKRKILNHIRIHEPKRASQVSECGGAGTGCGWCIPYLRRYFEQSRGCAVESEDLCAEEYARQRGQYIREGHGVPAAGAVPVPREGE